LEAIAISKDKTEGLENLTTELTKEYLFGSQARERNIDVSI
jgi:hypothetical protein